MTVIKKVFTGPLWHSEKVAKCSFVRHLFSQVDDSPVSLRAEAATWLVSVSNKINVWQMLPCFVWMRYRRGVRLGVWLKKKRVDEFAHLWQPSTSWCYIWSPQGANFSLSFYCSRLLAEWEFHLGWTLLQSCRVKFTIHSVNNSFKKLETGQKREEINVYRFSAERIVNRRLLLLLQFCSAIFFPALPASMCGHCGSARGAGGGAAWRKFCRAAWVFCAEVVQHWIGGTTRTGLEEAAGCVLMTLSNKLDVGLSQASAGGLEVLLGCTRQTKVLGFFPGL